MCTSHKRTGQMCHYLVLIWAISSAACPLSCSRRTDCWSVRTETQGFWILHGHLSTAEDDVRLLNRQRGKNDKETVTRWSGAQLPTSMTHTWIIVHSLRLHRQPVARKSSCSYVCDCMESRFIIWYFTTYIYKNQERYLHRKCQTRYVWKCYEEK